MPQSNSITPVNVPSGLWFLFKHEMKRNPAFKYGYRDGQKQGLNSRCLSKDVWSSYHSKIGVLVACWEQGFVDDIRIDRDLQVVEGLKNGRSVYLFIGSSNRVQKEK